MSMSRRPYPPEFRRQMVELVRAGRRLEELAEELGRARSRSGIWVAQADRDDGRRRDGATSVERDELARPRREVHLLREEREILKKAAAFFARETDRPR